MTESVNFAALVERAMSAGGRAQMRPVIEKELLHYDILFALERAALLDQLTFQGGTALRLCYGSPRFSEDLDFVSGNSPDRRRLQAMKSCVADYLGARYGMEVSVKEPRDLAAPPETRRVGVHRWQIRVVTVPERRDVPKQMIKIEVAEVPAYSRMPLLLRQQGAKIDPALIRNKIRDYSATDYRMNAERLVRRLPGIIHGKDFRAEMSRFIPLEVQERTLLKDKFLVLLERETARAIGSAVQTAA